MSQVRLPHLATPTQPEPFTAGSWVRLRTCPHGEAGVVRGMRFGRVVVHWPDLQFTGRHPPGALVAAEVHPAGEDRSRHKNNSIPAETAAPGARSEPRPNPYARMLAKLDAHREKQAKPTR